MNERIQELADQCHHQYSEHNINLEKFAELIVKECARLVDQDWHVSVAELKEHFGVE